MTQSDIEVIETQAMALGVHTVVSHYAINRFSITINNKVYSDFKNAVSALGTAFLKNKKSK